MNFRAELRKTFERRFKKEDYGGEEILEKIVLPYFQYMDKEDIKGEKELYIHVTRDAELVIILFTKSYGVLHRHKIFKNKFEKPNGEIEAYKYIIKKFVCENYKVVHINSQTFPHACSIKIN